MERIVIGVNGQLKVPAGGQESPIAGRGRRSRVRGGGACCQGERGSFVSDVGSLVLQLFWREGISVARRYISGSSMKPLWYRSMRRRRSALAASTLRSNRANSAAKFVVGDGCCQGDRLIGRPTGGRGRFGQRVDGLEA